MMRLRILTFFSLFLSFLFLMNRDVVTFEGIDSPVSKDWLAVNLAPQTPKEHIRPPDQTFLTFPEWFLVHSPAEEADYLQANTSTTFPFIGHIEQLWKSYGLVYKQIKDSYEFNTGYHVMILVIGVSTTVEYAIKSLYEKTIGRITNTNLKEEMTAEDKFNAKFTKDYVDFIMQTPWYEFDFVSQLKTLWTEVPFFEKNFIRKIERRYFLTTELGVKAFYGWLIKLGTKSAYEEPLLNTVIIVNKTPDTLPQNIKMMEKLSDGSQILSLPRYADFTSAINELSKQKISIKEIAGNNSSILVSILVPTQWEESSNTNYKLVFSQPIITKPNMKRVAISVLISKLTFVLKKFQKENVQIEHIYDF